MSVELMHEADKDAQPKIFTTEPQGFIKRGHGTVRNHCIEFIETLQAHYYKEIPIEQAKELFSQIIDRWDRATIQAYFGTQTGFKIHRLERRAQYQSGTVSMKRIELKQFVPHHKGYLEKLGLVTIEKRGETWFLILKNALIIPELGSTDKVSNDNFSFTPIHPIPNVSCADRHEPSLNSVPKEGSHAEENGEKRERVHRLRERNRSSESDLLSTPTLTHEEEAILSAKPSPMGEPDRAKIKWPSMPPEVIADE